MVVTLTSLQGYSGLVEYSLDLSNHWEIGEKLGITESTSRSNLVKARMKLKETLSARFDHGV